MDTQTLNLLPWNTGKLRRMRTNALLETGVLLSLLVVAWSVSA